MQQMMDDYAAPSMRLEHGRPVPRSTLYHRWYYSEHEQARRDAAEREPPLVLVDERRVPLRYAPRFRGDYADGQARAWLRDMLGGVRELGASAFLVLETQARELPGSF
jgi:hypothetical protein